jgi:hypothetical protein
VVVVVQMFGPLRVADECTETCPAAGGCRCDRELFNI